MSSISREFNASRIYGKTDVIPRKHHYQGKVLANGTTGEVLVYTINDLHNDFKRYVAEKSNGFTKIGLQYLNQSIEAYIYSILGAQAKTRVSIVSSTAGSLETQQVFRQLVNDAIINYDTTTWIQNMNKSVQDTNVTQNLAISPSTWLIPSKMIILKHKIAGYNNLLKTATPGMRFGINDKLNWQSPRRPIRHIPPKKTHKESAPHLESLTLTSSPSVVQPTPHQDLSSPDIHMMSLGILLGAATIGGYSLVTYVL